MSILDSLAKLAGGDIVGKVFDVVKEYLPPDMSPEKKAQVQLDLGRLALERDKQAGLAQIEAQKALTEQISALEGTASDLKAVPILGPIMLFLRGAQRPVWGFATLWLDYEWFSGGFNTLTDRQELALYAINLLVLIFLFGERAVMNVVPVLQQLLGKK